MFKVIRYCVQWTRKGLVECSEPYRDEERALSDGAARARTGCPVTVYQVRGEPMFDLWEEPRVIANFPARPLAVRAGL